MRVQRVKVRAGARRRPGQAGQGFLLAARPAIIVWVGTARAGGGEVAAYFGPRCLFEGAAGLSGNSRQHARRESKRARDHFAPTTLCLAHFCAPATTTHPHNRRPPNAPGRSIPRDRRLAIVCLLEPFCPIRIRFSLWHGARYFRLLCVHLHHRRPRNQESG